MKYPQYGNESSDEVLTLCICPKCGGHHRLYLNWTGRGVPRKFCAACRKLAANAGIEYSLRMPGNVCGDWAVRV